MDIKGYYRWPTVSNENIVFCAEDDLWSVSSKGGSARRLTANRGEVTHPFFSPDGKWIAFTGREEGHPEVYLMPADGGPSKRMTYLGGELFTAGWSPDGKSIIFASDMRQPFRRLFYLYYLDIKGGEPKLLPYGPSRGISYGPDGRVVIGRNTGDPAMWKRYRGGTAGEIWIDKKGKGIFCRLIQLKGNMANPMWLGDRVYFLSDHEGIGNLYSCLPSGTELKRETSNEYFYARNATTDGKRVVYHSGADIYLFDPETLSSKEIQIKHHTPQVQRNRKFVSPEKYLEDYEPSPDGACIALVSRGKSSTMGNWEGGVLRQAPQEGIRYRLTRWLHHKKRIVLVSDANNEERVELHYLDKVKTPKRFKKIDIGRPVDLSVSPKKDEIILTNHRQEIIWIGLGTGKSKILDKSEYGPMGISGFDFSPDGKWVAYAFAVSHRVRIIKICEIETGKKWEVTDRVLQDFAPAFGPEGKYLYFLSLRIFKPVDDNIHFSLNFSKGICPYLITLQKDLSSPFIPEPRGFSEEKETKSKKEPSLLIDFKGIKERIVPFPVDEGIYGKIKAIKDRVIYTTYPVAEATEEDEVGVESPGRASIKMYDMKKREETTLIEKATDFKLSRDGSTMVYREGNRLRAIKAGEKLEKEKGEKQKAGRKSGWLDLNRVKISVDPVAEWRQMFCEAWRLQRDNFWTEDISGIDWDEVFKRYYPLAERVASRSELSDLLWELQGELGTSHAYEFGGDYREKPEYRLGFLGADLVYNEKQGAYRFEHIVRGDPWDKENAPPLMRPGLNVKEGMLLLSIGGQKLTRGLSPNQLLVNQADTEIELTVADKDGSQARTVSVKTLKGDRELRYREWIEDKREYVHKISRGRLGYIHIPDMMHRGYAEFDRYFLVELDRQGLIVDLRFNEGGRVSQLLLEKLARKRIGYGLSRWGQPSSYPCDSAFGPMIAVTNEYAGSDGDIFCHSFKLMELGKLIGRRTWGGVIGIWPRHLLVDKTITTQPEFSTWFKDVGWGVENYGTDPDIEVDITPQDYVRGKDTQLDRAIKELLDEIDKNPPRLPKFDKKPRLAEH